MKQYQDIQAETDVQVYCHHRHVRLPFKDQIQSHIAEPFPL